MNDKDSLLRAICEFPDEDTPRLAFADWLDEHGGAFEVAWAELIRTQMTLARGAGDERERLTARDRELTPIVVSGWPKRMKFPAGLSWENWLRGFPLTLAGRCELVRAARPAFAERVPLRDFNLKDATDGDLEDFVTWPELRLVRKLAVWTENRPLTARTLIALAGCEHLANLERLRMRWLDLTDAGAEAFLDSPYMAQIIEVRITVGGVGSLAEPIRQRILERFGEWGIR